MTSFTDLYFGMADAKNEAINETQAFIDSFVDNRNAVSDIRSRKKFLLLGPKGCGKTALARYLELTADPVTEFVNVRDIGDLPLAEVEKLKTGEEQSLGRTITSWRLLLLCAILDLILKDQSSSLHGNREVERVVTELRKHGFMDPTPSRAVITASKTTLKLPIPKFGEVYARESTSTVDLYHLVPFLEKWVLENQSDNSYLIALDGLDSIYLNDPRFAVVISSLMQATYSLHQRLRSAESPAHIILLVRNDIFTRLHLADAGKMRRDLGIDLDWRILSGQPERAPLFRLINQKSVALISEKPFDVVGRYFDKDVELGGRQGAPRWVNTFQYLLQLTRHTPRDLLQLFEHIRIVADSPEFQTYPNGKLTPEIIREGVLQYSSKYFVDAIQNELVGKSGAGFDSDLVSHGLSALRHLPRRTFTAKSFIEELYGDKPSHADQKAAETLLRWFFFAGAIGNKRAGSEQSYMQFYHRREETEVYLKGDLVLHNALVYAWSIHW
ncbi:hypothetical protein OG979_21190 [Actinomadura citrea]|uniref:P-loop ATPase, Sll1717 family n=1 Tax=Actinomadura citrea TaxID=46158 RepID=UPI002E2A15AE|nr:hypothetical protein [Actinomadura citrea]